MTILAVAPAPVATSRPAAHPHPDGGVDVRSVVARVGTNLTVACVVPALIIYVTLPRLGVATAVLAALAWAYGAAGWRRLTGRPTSGLLVLAMVVLTMRTAFTLATGDPYVYFLEPIVTDSVVALLCLLSVATTRPVVARLAGDFYPLDPELLDEPRIRRLMCRLTLLWAGVGFLKAGVGFWLLETLPAAQFVLVKTIAVLALTGAGVVLTVRAALPELRGAPQHFVSSAGTSPSSRKPSIASSMHELPLL